MVSAATALAAVALSEAFAISRQVAEVSKLLTNVEVIAVGARSRQLVWRRPHPQLARRAPWAANPGKSPAVDPNIHAAPANQHVGAVFDDPEDPDGPGDYGMPGQIDDDRGIDDPR